MIDKAFSEQFAREWIDAWNCHDLPRVLSHYSDEFEMSSPLIVHIEGEPSGMLKGKSAVGAYWKKALQLVPDLRFELLATLIGVNSLTLYYKSARGLSAEVLHFDLNRKIVRAYAHYMMPPSQAAHH
jgi:SnoaL-like domain